MRIPVSEAKAQLTDLVRRAEAGEDVVLTRHGHPAVRLTPVRSAAFDRQARRQVLDAVRARSAGKAVEDADAARSQDFLYDEHGLPR